MESFCKFDTSTVIKAIKLLDKATDLQSDFQFAHERKLVFQQGLGLWNDAFLTLKKLEHLKPDDPEIKVEIGAYYEYLKKDMKSAFLKYKEADFLFCSILDSIESYAQLNEEFIISYITNLILFTIDSDIESMHNLIFQNYYSNKRIILKINEIKQIAEIGTREDLIIKKYFTAKDPSLFW